MKNLIAERNYFVYGRLMWAIWIEGLLEFLDFKEDPEPILFKTRKQALKEKTRYFNSFMFRVVRVRVYIDETGSRQIEMLNPKMWVLYDEKEKGYVDLNSDCCGELGQATLFRTKKDAFKKIRHRSQVPVKIKIRVSFMGSILISIAGE